MNPCLVLGYNLLDKIAWIIFIGSCLIRVCTTLTFSSTVASLRRPDRPSSSTLSPPPPLLNSVANIHICNKIVVVFFGGGVQCLSVRVLESRPRGCGFQPHQRHCILFLSKNINSSLVLVQPKKTSPYSLFCLFDLILYVPSTIFQLCRDGSSFIPRLYNLVCVRSCLKPRRRVFSIIVCVNVQ